jgi:hypothetical protein
VQIRTTQANGRDAQKNFASTRNRQGFIVQTQIPYLMQPEDSHSG